MILRKTIVALYEKRCAFCRLRIVTVDSETIVEGAHIKPFAEFRDDRVENGISLCKNYP